MNLTMYCIFSTKLDYHILQLALPDDDNVVSSTSVDRAVLFVLPCDQSILSVKAYCLVLLLHFCKLHFGDHVTAQEIVAVIDINHLSGITEFLQDTHQILQDYELINHTPVNDSTDDGMCLVLQIKKI